MLVLSRRPRQTIIITTKDGEKVSVCVVSVKGDQVRLGFTADDSTHILREELVTHDAT